MWATQNLLHLASILLWTVTGPTNPSNVHAEQIDRYQARMLAEAPPTDDARPGAAENTAIPAKTEAPADEPAGTFSGDFMERIQRQIPDPELAKSKAKAQIAGSDRQLEVETLERLVDRLETIARAERIHLTLEEALHRALVNSYAIRVYSYNPAIEATRVVEAEAAFDAAFFVNVSNNKQDRPAQNELAGTQIQTFTASSGFRKLLPSGMQVEASYVTSRTFNNFQFQTINPVWFSQFVVQFRQPLLRGFGLDFNRAQIKINELNRRRSTQEFRRQVRDILRQTEEAYWQLARARRNLVISARVLASFEQIYGFLDARKEFDVYRIQLADTKARLERSKAGFIELVATVFNAEDRLISLMNDPEIDLASDIEIIPVEAPHFTRPVIDRLAEVQTALDNRAEIVEAKLNIDIARIQVGASKNQALPQMDLTFGYSIDGLADSHQDAFSEVSKNDFQEYYVGVDFELPVGNRARRAALKRANLQYAQALASLKQTFEQIILDVNLATREVQVRFDQIDPGLASVEASEDQVDSIKARAEKKDFLTLNNELNAEQSLATARSDLLGAIVEYGIAIIDLERAKGTLLRYNNVDLVFDDSDDPAY